MKISVRRKISREKLISAAYQFLEQEGLVRPPAETIPEHMAITWVERFNVQGSGLMNPNRLNPK